MAKRKNVNGDPANGVKRRTEHGTCVKTGKCRDCAQGIFGESTSGFEYFDEDRTGRGFWFCRYCGSNHVTVVLDNGVEIEQGDLYGDGMFPAF